MQMDADTPFYIQGDDTYQQETRLPFAYKNVRIVSLELTLFHSPGVAGMWEYASYQKYIASMVEGQNHLSILQIDGENSKPPIF